MVDVRMRMVDVRRSLRPEFPSKPLSQKPFLLRDEFYCCLSKKLWFDKNRVF